MDYHIIIQNGFTLLWKKWMLLPIFLLAFISITCQESLPTYVAPTKVLSVNVETVEQLSDRLAPPEHQEVRFKLLGENVFTEVFYDTVDIEGSVTITWIRKEGLKRTIPLTLENFLNRNLITNGKMMIIPGQQFSIQFYWNMKGDDSTYFPSEMNYARLYFRNCGSYQGHTVVCSDPEDMMIEGDVKIFKNLGYVHIPAAPFTVTGRGLVVP